MVAHVGLHIYSGAPQYSAEANAKWRLYPPPYQGGYATPWLWIDGKNNGYNYSMWENAIYAQLLVPADVGLTHVGTAYDTALRSGELQVECYNSGSIPIITARLHLAITEDSINYTGSNGDPWHNGVVRDFVPDQNGTVLTLGPGATDTVTVPFSLNAAWVAEKVKLVVYLQNMTPQADSSLLVYQGLTANVLDYVKGVAEVKPSVARDVRVSVSPNPCRTGCEFALSGAAANGARITLYTPDGRLVSSIETASNRVAWSRAGLARGIYLYRVNAGTATAEGKLVVTD